MILHRFLLGVVTLAWFVVPMGASALQTPTAFTESLIRSGMILGDKIALARIVARMVEQRDEAAIDATNIEVRVSQQIQYADRTYDEGADIRGLLLLVQNTGETDRTLQGRRGCHVSYTIEQDGETLYDSAAHAPCTTNERSHFVLSAGATRLFEVRHKATAYPLKSGVYTMRVTYPGYGDGALELTIR